MVSATKKARELVVSAAKKALVLVVSATKEMRESVVSATKLARGLVDFRVAVAEKDLKLVLMQSKVFN